MHELFWKKEGFIFKYNNLLWTYSIYVEYVEWKWDDPDVHKHSNPTD